MTPLDPRSAFFDRLAREWDGGWDLPALAERLAEGIAGLGVQAEETIVDVGCGTGNLTRALARATGPRGRIVAVDVSAEMLEVAREKVRDARISWHLARADALPMEDGAADRVIFLCVWPHVDRPEATAREAWRVLRRGGSAHVWHLAGRARVNAIHAARGDAVGHDVLAPAAHTAEVFAGCGFELRAVIDADDQYLVTATKRSAR